MGAQHDPASPITPTNFSDGFAEAHSAPQDPQSVETRLDLYNDRVSEGESQEGQVILDPIPSFSNQLEEAMAEVIPSDDPLDQADFDPIAYINATFPDEESLAAGKLEVQLSQLRRRVVTLSEGITKDVREHSGHRSRTKQAISTAGGAIQELFGKIRDIKEKAVQSETMVQEICRDIKQLDYAKKHLTNTFSALRNLHSLVALAAGLEVSTKNEHYGEAARQFQTIEHMLMLFEPYKDVPKIRAIRTTVEALKASAKTMIFAKFRSVIPAPKPGTDLRPLVEACAVVDALEPKVKKELLTMFSKAQLEPYVSIFDIHREGGKLEETERRYTWLDRLLTEFESTFGAVFPRNWDVPAIIVRDFCVITKQHLTQLLAASNGKFETTDLIKALNQTIEFERRMQRRFQGVVLNDAEEDETNEAAAERIRQKHLRGRQPETKEPAHVSSISFDRIISECFTPYMAGYVELERTEMRKLIEKFDATEQWSLSGELKEKARLAGSDELFLYIKRSIKRCSKLMKDQIFFNLFKEYKRALSNYVSLLTAHIPRKQGDATLTQGEIVSTCLIVNTSEYCIDIIKGLEDSIRKTIDDVFKEHINMSDEQEQFSILANNAIKNLVEVEAARAGRIFAAFSRSPNWGTLEAVLDHSDYVNQLSALVADVVPTVSALVSDSYHNLFCTQFANAIIPKYTENIFKIKRLNETGAQQLSLDAHQIKSLLATMPTLTLADDDRNPRKAKAASRIFTRVVTTEMGKVEALLKVLLSPHDKLITSFKALVQSQKPYDDLSKIMNLRGFTKREQTSMIDSYNASVPVKDRIVVEASQAPSSSAFPIDRLRNIFA